MKSSRSLPAGGLTAGLLVLLSLGSPEASGEILFETRCDSESLWELLDLREGAQVLVEEDRTAPAGYGPRVLKLSGDETLLFAKGVRFGEGTILTLWKDEDPENRDCDGVIFFHADYPEDLAQAYNTKEHRPHYWIEQDYDVGFQIKRQDAKGQDYPLIEKAGVGKTADDWNRSGWTWQKLNFGSGGVRAKYWSAAVPEPPEWQIEESGWEAREGRLGLRVWSGFGSFAYFAVSTEDISVPPPLIEMAASRALWFVGQAPTLRLFLNLPTPEFATALRLKTRREGETESVETIRTPFVAGHTQIDFMPEDPDPGFKLPGAESPGGQFHLSAELLDGSDRTVASVSRTLEFRSPAHYTDRLAGMREIARQQIWPETARENERALEASSALALLDLAERVFSEGRIDAVDRTLEFAKEALDPSLSINRFTCDGTRFSAKSFVMGQSYVVEVDWRAFPDAALEGHTARLEVTDDLGIETPITLNVPLPPAGWSEGAAHTRFEFKVPEEFPRDLIAPIERPAVREGWHRIWLSLWHAEDGGHEWLDLPFPETGGDFSRRYEVGRVYITQNQIEAREIKPSLGGNGKLESIEVELRNASTEIAQIQVGLRILTESGTEVNRRVVSVDLAAESARRLSLGFENFPWWGPFKASVEVVQGGRLQTAADSSFEIPAPAGWEVEVTRANEVWNRGGQLYTPLIVHATGPSEAEVSISVSRNGTDWGQGTLTVQANRGGRFDLGVRPALGAYQVTIALRESDSRVRQREFRVLAPVFENREGVLFLNGEEFIVKGVNVHGLIGNSPHRARLMMKILKDIGFNMLRGDYPPPWEVDIGEEENLGWLVLAPFSVTNTNALKERYRPNPFARIREISRRFIRAYRDKPATWFWNSCNEVTGETDDLLTCLYPLYKEMDPYHRPVVYANLTGQDRTLGQDLMGINYYYNYENTVETRQPLVLDSLRKAKTVGIPCIFNEFNCWFGPVYSEGARSVRGFYEYGIEHGMAGGFLYQLREDRDRHPGVVVDDYTLWTNPTFESALRKAFADLEIEVAERSNTSGTLILKNVRPFTLRRVSCKVWEGGKSLGETGLEDIPPRGEAKVSIPLERGGDSHILETQVTFTTHFGIESKALQTLYLESLD